MAETGIYHALGLHLHQPPGNLRLLLDVNPWEAASIIRCYERVIRYAWIHRDVARLHVGFSGVLLEQLLDPVVVDGYRHLVDIPAMLEQFRAAENIELVGMGYYHPIFPLIPRADWSEQLEQGRAILERVFGRAPRGFWPPELAFSMELIPSLVRAGYEYAVVDGVHVRPEDGISDVLRPYDVCHEGVCISVVPRDRDLSRAQQHGLNPRWFQDEVRWRASSSPRPQDPRLFTTWSDGENGPWLREPHEPSGFFGHFFEPLMDTVRGDHPTIQPVLLSDYLGQMRPLAHARVQTGSWNMETVAGGDLVQWTGSERQRQAVAEVTRLSARYWALCRERSDAYQLAGQALVVARRLILEAETSCFLFWGDAWLPHLFARIEPADRALCEAESILAAAPTPAAAHCLDEDRPGSGPAASGTDD